MHSMPMNQGYQMPNSYSSTSSYQNYGANSAAVTELNTFKSKCQRIIDEYFKTLD